MNTRIAKPYLVAMDIDRRTNVTSIGKLVFLYTTLDILLFFSGSFFFFAFLFCRIFFDH